MSQRYVDLPNGVTVYENGVVVMPHGEVGYDLDFSQEKFAKIVDDFGCKTIP